MNPARKVNERGLLFLQLSVIPIRADSSFDFQTLSGATPDAAIRWREEVTLLRECENTFGPLVDIGESCACSIRVSGCILALV
jgi:hypothetical protein